MPVEHDLISTINFKTHSTFLVVTLHELFYGSIQKYSSPPTHWKGNFWEFGTTVLNHCKILLFAVLAARPHIPVFLYEAFPPHSLFNCKLQRRHCVCLTPLSLARSLALAFSLSHSISKESAGLAVCLLWPPSNTNTELFELKVAVLIVTQQCFILRGPKASC